MTRREMIELGLALGAAGVAAAAARYWLAERPVTEEVQATPPRPVPSETAAAPVTSQTPVRMDPDACLGCGMAVRNPRSDKFIKEKCR